MDLSGTQRAPNGGAASAHLLEHVEQWLSRRWVPILINLLALALLSFSLARGTWRLLTPPVTDGPSSGASTNASSGDYNLQSLLSSNVFGQLASTDQGPESVEEVPISSL